MTTHDRSKAPDIRRGRDAAGHAPSPPRLVEPAAAPPTRDEEILAWVRERAARELTQGG